MNDRSVPINAKHIPDLVPIHPSNEKLSNFQRTRERERDCAHKPSSRFGLLCLVPYLGPELSSATKLPYHFSIILATKPAETQKSRIIGFLIQKELFKRKVNRLVSDFGMSALFV